MSQSELFLLVLLVIFALPLGLWHLTGRAAWAPLVVVQILTGILLGPGILGALAPGLWSTVFTTGVTSMISGVALWAVILFVFLAGLELDLRAAWAERGETLTVAAPGPDRPPRPRHRRRGGPAALARLGGGGGR